ncbi:MAG: glycosyltransferase [Acidimicrobiales bacterium]|nr:glycosyltransferase [Acidimicrobiales bacterium]MCB9372770.1 glycosyltransferase [Microthrixaceae bacterium]
MRVELVHEWLTNLAGSEKVVGALRRAYPGAGVNTSLFYAPEFPGWDPVHTTFLQRFATRRGAHLRVLPLIPPAMHTLRVPDADLVITSFHSFALNARVRPGTPHLVYCHTPPRFLWEREQLAGERGLSTGLTGAAAALLKPGDRRRSRRPDLFLANSTEVAGRIRSAYGRDAEVVHPPVEVERFAGALDTPAGDYFVSFSRLVAYKRVDLVIEAFRELGWPLVVAGEGRARAELEASAPANVRFAGRVPDDELPGLLAGARGLVFAGVEDFGITMVEAMAAGTPVVALDAGGARDSVEPGRSGVLFAEPTVASLVDAVRSAAAVDWDRADVSASAHRFTEARFTAAVTGIAESLVRA